MIVDNAFENSAKRYHIPLVCNIISRLWELPGVDTTQMTEVEQC